MARSGLSAPRPAPEDEVLVREAAGPTRTGTAARTADPRPHHPPRPHTTRSERTPVTPTGPRRPPHADRTPRTAPLAPAPARGRTGGS
ncbi:Phosphatase PAP2 family protein OS=Streptomyces rimosus subsp. rimosus (strain ATCC/ DSM 40260 / JCM 4667 / NRRL 2234) OX=1265868 GN=SRIM_008520 PE=4 SV=1 [Streptomyces rimosus subsp. rimosus]